MKKPGLKSAQLNVEFIPVAEPFHDHLTLERQPMLRELYALFPQPGEPSHKPVWVRVSKGGQVAPHRHSQWTLVYYLEPGDPPVAIVVLGERILPQAGHCLILPPMTDHAVEKSESEIQRVSFALRWVTS